jgi:SH3-like domain-containing protein
MNANVPAIFESAIAEVITTFAQISDFPRIRTWRSIDADNRWSPDSDYAVPLIVITSSTPEPDQQDQRQVTVTVGAITNAADDQSHEQIAQMESELQGVLDKLESQYCKGGSYWETFISKVAIENAGAKFSIHVGGVESGPATDPAIEEGMNVISMSIIVHYYRSDR